MKLTKFSKREKISRISLSKRDKFADLLPEFEHCLLCGKPSSKVGQLGTASKYKCNSCGYGFSNR